MAKTLKQQALDYLQAKGWSEDKSTKCVKYLVLSKPGINYHYYLGRMGAVRRGMTVSSSVSVKLKLVQETLPTKATAPEAVAPKPPTAKQVKAMFAAKDEAAAKSKTLDLLANEEDDHRPDPIKRVDLEEASSKIADQLRLQEQAGRKVHPLIATPAKGSTQATTAPACVLPVVPVGKRSVGAKIASSANTTDEGKQSAPFPASPPASITPPPSSPAPVVAPPAVATAKPSTLGQLLQASNGKPASDGTVAGYKPTEEQAVILEAAKAKGLKCLVIGAGAGAGKTSTLKMLEQELPGRGQYTAFNSSLVTESKAKFTRCAVNTTHSLAFGAVGKQYAHRLNSNRVKSYEVARMLGIGDFALDTVGADGLPSKKNLQAAFLAGQVMQAVRKFCQSADYSIGAQHVKYIDGIDMPMNGKKTYANNDLVKEYLSQYLDAAWKDLSSTDGQLPFNHDVYVKVWQLGKPVISADYILVDECFPAGTPVESEQGPVAIEDVVENPGKWRILASPDGGKTVYYSGVTSAYRTPRNGPLVRIQHEYGEVTCTANHPLWIDGRGWVAAGLVESGDSLSCLRQAYSAAAENMFPVVRSEMAGRSSFAGVGSCSQGQDFQDHEAGVYLATQPGGSAGSESQDFRYPQGTGDHISTTGWKREGTNPPRVDAVSGAGPTPAELALEPRLCRLQWTTKEGTTNQLQDRHSVSEMEGCSRSGRPIPRTAQGRGREEDGGSMLSRVASVEVYQPAGGDQSEISGRSDCHYVYTLSVEAGTYFANGVLVKNCQDTAPVFLSILQQQQHALLVLVGDDNQQIYEWRGAVNALASFPGAPRKLLSQSFRFGQTIADVANSILKGLEEPTDLVMKGLESIPSIVGPVASPRCILCRTNAAAVSNVLRHKAEGGKPHLIGGGAETVKFVKGAQDLQNGRSTTHPELCCFKDWSEVEEYSKLDEGEDLRLMVKLIEDFGCEAILDALVGMPEEENATLVVSTAHKSKGREWDSVRLAGDFKLPNQMGDSERRLLYVAATRAKQQLDISICPAFCGGIDKETEEFIPGIKIAYTVPMPTEDALEAFRTAKGQKATGKPPTAVLDPSTAPQSATPAPSQNGAAPAGEVMFTWSKDGDSWCIRGPAGMVGKRVPVTKRNGQISHESLAKVVKEFADACLYATR